MVDNKRVHPRFATRLEGRLLSLDGLCNYMCVITDVSEGGARVSTAEFGLVPSRVFLLEAKSADIFECDVMWRRAGEVGLRLIDAAGRSRRKTLLGLCLLEAV